VRRCIGSYRIAGGYPFGLDLRIWSLRPPKGHNGACRVSIESHGPPLQQSIDCHAMGFFSTTYFLLVPRLHIHDDALGPCCPTDHILAPYTWQLIQSLDDVLSHPGRYSTTFIIILALINGTLTCLIQLETHEAIHCAPQPLGSTTNVFLGNQGAAPLVIIMRALFILADGGLI